MHVSKLFTWYANDFASHGGAAAWIRGYWKGAPFIINDGDGVDPIAVTFQDYNWGVNTVENAQKQGFLQTPGAANDETAALK
jgi:hypothetical protein